MYIRWKPFRLPCFALLLIVAGCGGDAEEEQETAEVSPSTVDEGPNLSDLSEEERRFLGLDSASDTDDEGELQSLPELSDGGLADHFLKQEFERLGGKRAFDKLAPDGLLDSDSSGGMSIEISDVAFPPEYEGSTPEEMAAIVAIKNAGGEVRYRSPVFGEPDEGIAVTLSHTSVDADLLHLTKIADLQQLGLSNCYRLTDNGMETIGRLTELDTLYLGCTDFTDAGFSHLARLQNLKDLTLWNTFISDPGLKPVGRLANLRNLFVDYTQVGDAGLVHLAHLTNLQKLGLCHTNVTDAGLEHLRHLTNLETLALDNTQIIGTGLHHLKNLTQLTELSLAETRIDDHGVKYLRGPASLEILSLHQTRVSDAGILQLAGLSGLKNVRAMNTTVTQSGHDALMAKLPEVHVSFGETEFYANVILAREKGYHPDEEGSVERLKRLQAELTIGQDLRVWWVQAIGTRFSDKDVELLRALPKLNRIELTNCRRFTDAGLEALQDLPRLRQVFVQNSGVTREGVDRVQRLMPHVDFFF